MLGEDMLKKLKTLLPLYIVIACIALGGLFWRFVLHHDGNKPVETVFEKVQTQKDYIQVSLYSILQLKDSKVYAKGHVRYNNNGMIYGLGNGKLGADLLVLFDDKTSPAYKTCAEFMQQGIPYGMELFLSGNGEAQTSHENVVSNSSVVKMHQTDSCISRPAQN